MGEPRLPGESRAAATSAAAVVLLCRDLCFPIGGTRLAHPAPLRDFISESQPNEAVSMETVALVPVATSWGFTRAEGRGTTVTSADGLILPGAASRRPSAPVGIGRSWGPGGPGGPRGPGCRSRSFAGRLRWMPSPFLVQAAAAGAQARCGGWGRRPAAGGGTGGSWFSGFLGLSVIAAAWVELGQAISPDAGL